MKNETRLIGMPDVFVYVKTLGLGWLITETFRLAFLLGTIGMPGVYDPLASCKTAAALTLLLFSVSSYVFMRGGVKEALRIVKSVRIDLLLLLLMGAGVNVVSAYLLADLHSTVSGASPEWPSLILFGLMLAIGSPLLRECLSRPPNTTTALRFLQDDDIDLATQDVLKNAPDALSFADMILESEGNSSLVFGIDGPWGIGKSSFINLVAERLAEKGRDRVVVFRFEPLRYAAEADLPSKFIRDLTAAISRDVYAPEFPPAVSRYSRMLKGNADITFLGFKISFEPTNETVDEALTAIDDVLRRIRRRVIVVIDDLDRLEADAVNNVLFAIRRTYKLSQSTYLLCYDTEVLAQQGEDAQRTRHFLEKFITIKLSLFVDSQQLSSYLRTGWNSDPTKVLAIPTASMQRLASVCGALANMLDGASAARYRLLAGDLRKIKRFINAALMMRMEDFDIEGTDFYADDLVHLILLHLHYPGLFRELYSEETGGRRGRFSVRRVGDHRNRSWANAEGFAAAVDGAPDDSAKFLLRSLFDVTSVGLDAQWTHRDERFFQGRACFNEDGSRTLQKYLLLIVRFTPPDLKESIRFYEKVVDGVLAGQTIPEALSVREFNLSDGDDAHDQFWRLLTSRSREMSQGVADHSIDALIKYLPKYSTVRGDSTSPRTLAVFRLGSILDTAGWGRKLRRPTNSVENLTELARRIFGEGEYTHSGIIDQLLSNAPRPLAWNDLLVFRMICCADRGGMLHNVYTALVKHEDPAGKTEGFVSDIARLGMRGLSQAVFACFKRDYILPRRNFFDAFATVTDADLLGEGKVTLARQIPAARQRIMSYVIYQLTNDYDAANSGPGCGFYDEEGDGNKHGISILMNRYLFDFCFSIEQNQDNAHHFAEYCLRNFQNNFFTGEDGDGFTASEAGLVGGVNKAALIDYWRKNRASIRALNLTDLDRRVFTDSYDVTYRQGLPTSFAVLDRLVEEADQKPASP